MIFEARPQKRRRSPAFAGSVGLHAALAVVLILWPSNPYNHSETSVIHRYHVRFFDLSLPKRSTRASGAGNGGLSAGTAWRQGVQGGQSGVQGAAAKAVEARRRVRPFELAPVAKTDPVKQTVIQPDILAKVMLPPDVPIPAAIMWTQAQPPPFPTKRFVAPPLKAPPKVSVNISAPPTLKLPNGAVMLADVRVAPTPINELARLPRPPTMSSPVVVTGEQEAKEVPQTVSPRVKDENLTNLISIPDSPALATTIAVLPPANQIAPPEPGGAQTATARNENAGGAGQATSGTGGNSNGSGNGGSQGQGTAGEGNGGQGSGAGVGGMGSGVGNGGTGSGVGAGGNGGIGNGGSGGGANAGSGSGAGSGTGNGSAGSGELGWVAGKDLTRITMAKEGKFNVVVLGSEASTLYPESAGSLTGRIIYTVYLDVRLRKKWILEYCLPRTVEQRATVRGRATPVDPPWPFLILRPDRFKGSDFDYVMLHGNLTEEGRLNELAVVYPQMLPERESLIQSLQQWAFRPASRDGERIAVEVLLIIPGQPD